MTTLEAYEIVMNKVQTAMNYGADFRMKYVVEYGIEPDEEYLNAELPYDKWVNIWTPLRGTIADRILSELDELGITFDTAGGGTQWFIDCSLVVE